MQDEKKKIKPGDRGIIDYDEQAYNYCVSGQPVRPKVESEKVTNVVGTFLTEDSDGFLVPVTKTGSEKVTNMVGTFLN